MNSLWRAIGLGGSAVPNFEYTIDEAAPAVTLSSDAILPWVLRPAKRNDDGMAVTVFSFCLTGRDSNSQEMARNVLKKCKTLMLPGFLRTYDATEYKETIYIATEPIVSLQSVISNDTTKIEFYEEASGEKYSNAVALGLKYVAQALNAIHKHNLVHGNVGPEEVFVTRGGEWKLFGLELVGPWGEDHSLLKRNASLLPEYRRAAVQDTSNVYDVDAWQLGCLIYTVFSSAAASTSPKNIKVADLRSCRTMPRTLQSAFMALTGTNPKLRMSFGKFLEECEFISGSDYVQMVNHLDNLAVMDAVDRDNLYRKLATQMDEVPLCACKHIVLAKLLTALSFGGGSAAVLEPILKIGARLPAEEFSQHVGPMVTNMFQSPDHLVRCRLLSSSSQYVKLLPKDLVNDKIYPHYQTGFASRHADIRELTVRALVDFAPLLHEKILINDVPRHIGTLQQDREGPIRTNATICLSMIAPSLPESIRSKTLVSGFGRMLKDPFVPSRTAALKSILGTMDSYAPQQVAELLMPAVCPCAVDAHAEVREAALGLLSEMLRRLGESHKTMPSVGPDGQTLGSPHTPAPASSSTTAAASASGSGGAGWGNFFGGATVQTTATPSTPSPVPSTPSVSPPPPLTSGVSKPTRATSSATGQAPASTTNAKPAATPIATTNSFTTSGKSGWGEDNDDDMWGEPSGGTKTTTSNAQSSSSPTNTASTIRKPAATSSTVPSTQQQQMDDFFGSTAGSTTKGPAGSSNSLNSTLNSTTGGVARPGGGGAMKLGGLGGGGGVRKLGLGGGASKVE